MLWEILSFLLSPLIFLAVLLTAFAVRGRTPGGVYKRSDGGVHSTDAYEFFMDLFSLSKSNRIFAAAMIVFLVINTVLMIVQGVLVYSGNEEVYAAYSEEYAGIISNMLFQELLFRLIIPAIMTVIALILLIWTAASTKVNNKKTDDMLNLLNENGLLIDAYNDYVLTSSGESVTKNLFADCLLGERYIFSVSQKLIIPLTDVDHWYPMNVKNMKAAVLCRNASRDSALLFGNQKTRDDFTAALDVVLRRYKNYSDE